MLKISLLCLTFRRIPFAQRRRWLVRFRCWFLHRHETSFLFLVPCKWLLIFPKTAPAKYIGNFIIFYGAPEKDVKHLWNFAVSQRRKRTGKKESTFRVIWVVIHSSQSTSPVKKRNWILARLSEKRDEKGEKGGKSFLFFHSISFAGDHHSRSFISFLFARRYTLRKKHKHNIHIQPFSQESISRVRIKNAWNKWTFEWFCMSISLFVPKDNIRDEQEQAVMYLVQTLLDIVPIHSTAVDLPFSPFIMNVILLILHWYICYRAWKMASRDDCQSSIVGENATRWQGRQGLWIINSE